MNPGPPLARANPIRGSGGAGFPLLMPDTFTELHKEAPKAAHCKPHNYLTVCRAPVNLSLLLFTKQTQYVSK